MDALTLHPVRVMLAPFQFPYWITTSHIAGLVTLAATFQRSCVARGLSTVT